MHGDQRIGDASAIGELQRERPGQKRNRFRHLIIIRPISRHARPFIARHAKRLGNLAIIARDTADKHAAAKTGIEPNPNAIGQPALHAHGFREPR